MMKDGNMLDHIKDLIIVQMTDLILSREDVN